MRKYFMHHKLLTLLVTMMVACTSLFRVAAALVNTYVLNSLVQRNSSKFILYISLNITIYLLFGVLLFLTMYTQGVLTQKMSFDLRMGITKNITSGGYYFFHRHDTGTYGSWLTNDINLIETQGFDNYFNLVQVGSDTLFAGAALLSFHWSLVVAVVFLAFLTIGVPQLGQHKMQRVNVNLAKGNEKFLAQVQSLLKGFDTLFSLNLQQRLAEKIKAPAEKVADLNVKQKTTIAQLTMLGQTASIISQVGMIGLSGVLILRNLIPIGAILSTGSLSGTIFINLANFGPILAQLKSVRPLFEKYAVDADQNSCKTVLDAKEPVTIQMQRLSYQYSDSNQVALKPISLAIQPGDKVAIVGPSGVGKSTLLNILDGKLSGYQGSVQVSGKQLDSLSGNSLRSKILYVDQVAYVFDGTVRDNLTMGDQFSDTEIEQALQRADLADFVHQLPQGIDTPVGEDGRLFSGGQRQRLAIARGLLRHRQVMLIDEGTSSLDKESALKVENSFLNQRDLTVIFVTHQLHSDNEKQFNQVVALA